MLREARIIRILYAKKYKYWFRFLHVIEDSMVDMFLRQDVDVRSQSGK